MISTRGRYAVRILLDLAEHADGALIPMKEVAARQGISLKYIERIMPALRNSGLIESTHGIGGGYRLAKPPETVTLWEILSLAEGDLAPVACLETGAEPCGRAPICKTPMSTRSFREKTTPTRCLSISGATGAACPCSCSAIPSASGRAFPPSTYTT